ncbi:hypothetical protein [Archangium primigenium]|uniref:hypothetical protein n=1 Tax=[Archangium] primigenium TaxID=2792470 RepID=UPI001957D486|nr:hypothetical protein [Archangium primigenium]MBM7116414.1 hypothetical protein [Archangium primigenium]
MAVAVGASAGWAVGVLVRGTDDELDELQDELDALMEECAERAEQTINRRRLGGRVLSPMECNEEVGTEGDGKRMTRAMALGSEKHTEAFACLRTELEKLMAGFFLIEQRYRFDQKTGRIEPIGREEEDRLGRSGRSRDLEGTLKPDLVIHSGDPSQVRFVYDFKFPCVKGTPATWRVYARGPYRDQTQGQIYSRAFGVPPGRVEPGRKGVIR